MKRVFQSVRDRLTNTQQDTEGINPNATTTTTNAKANTNNPNLNPNNMIERKPGSAGYTAAIDTNTNLMMSNNMTHVPSAIGIGPSSSSSSSTSTALMDGIALPTAHSNSPTSATSRMDMVARSDILLPRRERRKSSIIRHETMQSLKDLPHLKDTPMQKREALFQQKLQLCSIIFNFDDPTLDKRGKDLKRSTLVELVDYVNSAGGQKIFTEVLMPEIISMVTTNICRALPVQTEDFDPEEDEPVLEPAWPHLQAVYEFFLRFIVSSEVNTKIARKYVNQKFCLQLTELFDSEDPRERDYLKTILHRIYGKFMSLRSFIRKAISNVFYRFVYETERHNGIGELLEILGSIINGFAMPLKTEHVQFLEKALLPLHKPKRISSYHQQLSYCITQYVEKDPETSILVTRGLLRYWPWSCSSKQVLFLSELEGILELMGTEQLQQVYRELFLVIGRCLNSQHFQVSERTLFLWNNTHLVNNGTLSRQNAHLILPLIYGPLYKNSLGHWNSTVENLAQNVLKLYMEYDVKLYETCSTSYALEEENRMKEKEEKLKKWKRIEEIANHKLNARS